MIVINGTLPVAMTVLDGQTSLKIKSVVMSALTVSDALNAQASLRPDQYTGVAELCTQTKLLDENSNEYPLEYDALLASSKQNLDYLSNLKAELDAKERAES